MALMGENKYEAVLELADTSDLNMIECEQAISMCHAIISKSRC